MFIVLQHRITNPQTAFARGQNLLDGNGAPQGTHVLQFTCSPSRARPAGGRAAPADWDGRGWCGG